MDRQVCVIKTLAYRVWTDRQTHTGTDKSLKTGGPKILSNYIFYFKTVIIGGPIKGYLNSSRMPQLINIIKDNMIHWMKTDFIPIYLVQFDFRVSNSERHNRHKSLACAVKINCCLNIKIN